MTKFYVNTGGSALNSGSTDVTADGATGTTYLFSGAAGTDVGAVITLVGCTDDLSLLPLSGAAQATINLAASTVSNRKIFKITAVDNVLKTVTLDAAPSLTGGTSAWKIGGQFVWTPANIEAGVAAVDVVELANSPASTAADWITGRVAGSSAGVIKVIGKTGTRPVITNTGTTQCIEGGSVASWWFENLELAQQGASGNVAQAIGTGTMFYNVKVSDGGGAAIAFGVDGVKIIACELTGVSADGVSPVGGSCSLIGNYIHDLTGDGLEAGAMNAGRTNLISRNIFDTCSARGIYFSSSSVVANSQAIIDGNTIYGCGDSGLEVVDADYNVVLINNVFSENGNAAGEYNVEFTAGAIELIGFHGWNVFFHSGGGGGANLSNLTVNAQVAASEFTTDPVFTNAAGGDFSIGTASPAKATGFPGQFLGGSLGYLDIGAVQRQETGGGSAGMIVFPNTNALMGA